MAEDKGTDTQFNESEDGFVVEDVAPFIPSIEFATYDFKEGEEPSQAHNDGDATGYSYQFNQGYVFNTVSDSQIQEREDRKVSNMGDPFVFPDEHDIYFFVEVVIDATNFLINSATFTGVEDPYELITDFPHIIFDQYDSDVTEFTGYYPILRMRNGDMEECTQRSNIILSDRQFQQKGISVYGDSAHVLKEGNRKDERFPVRVRAVQAGSGITVQENGDYITIHTDTGGAGDTPSWSGENCGDTADWWAYKEFTVMPAQFRGLTAGEGVTFEDDSDCVTTISVETGCCTGFEDIKLETIYNTNNFDTYIEFPPSETSTCKVVTNDKDALTITDGDIILGDSGAYCADVTVYGSLDVKGWDSSTYGTITTLNEDGEVSTELTSNANGGQSKTLDSDGRLSTKEGSLASKKGFSQTFNAAGDKPLTESTADTNGGQNKTFDEDGLLSTKEGSLASKKGFSQTFNAAGDKPLTESTADTNGGQNKTFDEDGLLSTKEGSLASKKGFSQTFNAAGDKPLTESTADTNGGQSKTFDEDGNVSTEASNTANKEGSIKTFNAAGDKATNEMSADGAGNAVLSQRNSAGTTVNQLAGNSATNTFFNAGLVGVGTNAPTAGTSLDVRGPLKVEDSSTSTDGTLRLGSATDKTISFVAARAGLVLGAGVEKWTSDGYGSLSFFPDNSAGYSTQDGYLAASSPATGSAILGGSSNSISGHYNVIVGGAKQLISGKSMNFIGGGSGIDILNSEFSVSVGGRNNDISGSNFGVIGGGYNNLIRSSNQGFIAAGYQNTISGAHGGVIGGGQNNLVEGESSVIGGGQSNKIRFKVGGNDGYNFIAAGASNVIIGNMSAIGGGSNNTISGAKSVIIGGDQQYIKADDAVTAGNYSFVSEGHDGAFVFTDSITTPVYSTGANTMHLKFKSGVHITTDSGLYINGNPVLTGETPEGDTLQSVTTRGNETTTSIISSGPFISGVTGQFSDTVTARTGIFDVFRASDGTIDSASNIKMYDGGSSKYIYGANWGAGYHTNALTAITFELAWGVDSPRVKLEIDDAFGDDALGLRFGANAQKFNIYNTYTSATDYERAALRWDDDVFSIGTETGSAGGDVRSLDFRVSGQSALYIDSGTQNIGVGTSNPLTLIDTRQGNGAVQIDSQSISAVRSNAYLRFAGFNLGYFNFKGTADSFATTQIGAAINSWTEGNGSYNWQDTPSANLLFLTTPNVLSGALTERMRISADGYVGIGTTGPIAQLDVVGTGLFSSKVGIGTDVPAYPLEVIGGAKVDSLIIEGGYAAIDAPDSNYLRVHGTAGVRLTTWDDGYILGLAVDSDVGNVGIKNDSPNYALDVSGSVAGTGIGGRITLNGTGYLLSGDSPAETQTLQDVTTNGNTTTTSMSVQGQYLSGVSGVFDSVDITGAATLTVSGKVGIGVADPIYDLEVDGVSGTIGIGPSNVLKVGHNSSLGGGGGAAKMGLWSIGGGQMWLKGYADTYIGYDKFVTIKDGGSVGIGTTAPDEKLDIMDGCLSITSGLSSNIYLNSDTNNAGEHEIKYGFYANKSYPVSIVGKATAGYCRGTLQIRVSKTLSDGVSATSADTVAEFKSGEVVTYQKLSVHDDLIEMGDNFNAGTKAIKFSRSENKAAIYSVPEGAYGGGDIRFTAGTENTSAKKTEADATVRIAPEGGVAIGNAYIGDAISSGRLIVEERVGIGTAAPANRFHLYDGTAVDAFKVENYNRGAVWNSLGGGGMYSEYQLVGAVKFRMGQANHLVTSESASNFALQYAGDLIFAYGVTEAMRMDHAGRIGIKNNDPQYALDVSGDVAGTGVAGRITLNGTGYLLSGDSPAETQTLQDVTTNGDTTTTNIISEKIVSGVSGLFSSSVGIGTSAPSYDLEIVGVSPTLSLKSTQEDSDPKIIFSDYAQTLGFEMWYDGNTEDMYFDNHYTANSDTVFRTHVSSSPVEVLRLTDDGKVGIKNTNPQYALDVSGEARVSSNLRIGNYGLISENSQLLINQSAYYPIVLKTNNTERMRVAAGGNVGIGTAIPNGALHLYSALSRTLLFSNPTIGASTSDGTYMGTASTSDDFYIVNQENGKITLGTNNTHRFEIDSNGRVGIGDVDYFDPAYTLHVSGDVGGTGVAGRITLNGTGYLLSGDSPAETQTLQDVTTNGNTTTNSIIVDEKISGVSGLFSSSVGIGTTAPSLALLQVEDDGGEVLIGSPTTSYGGIGFDTTFTSSNAALFGLAGATIIGVKAGGNIEHKIGNDSSQGLLKQSPNTLAYTDGDVGIGTGDPAVTLDVNGNMRIRNNYNGDYWVQWMGVHSDSRMRLRDSEDYNIIQVRPTSNMQMFGEGQGSNDDWAFGARAGYAAAAGLSIGNNLMGSVGTHKSLGISTPQCAASNLTSAPSDDYIEFNTYAVTGNAGVGVRPAIRMAASGFDFHADEENRGFNDDPHFSINQAGYSYFTGSVGIGTTAPDTNLEIRDDTLNSKDILHLRSSGDNLGDYVGMKFTTAAGGAGPHAAIRTYVGPYGNDSYISLLTTTDGGTLTQGLTQAHNGYVGIGTNNPTEALTIDGNIKIADTDKSIIGYSATESIRFYNPTNEIIFSAATAVRFPDIRIAGNNAVENIDGDQYWQFYNQAYDGFARSLRFNVPIVVETSEQPILTSRTNLEFRIDSNNDSTSSKFFVTRDTGEATVDELFTIKEDGNVGIGTVSPAYTLDVVGTGRFSSRVGIGTSSPSYELDVNGTTRSTYYIGGAYLEENVSSSKLKFYTDGTVLVMDENGSLKPCEKENDTLVFGVSKKDFDQPVVLGAEPVLVTGPIKVGDYIVTSSKQGHGQAMKEERLGAVIAQAMEKGDGGSHHIKAMVRKM